MSQFFAIINQFTIWNWFGLLPAGILITCTVLLWIKGWHADEGTYDGEFDALLGVQCCLGALLYLSHFYGHYIPG